MELEQPEQILTLRRQTERSLILLDGSAHPTMNSVAEVNNQQL